MKKLKDKELCKLVKDDALEESLNAFCKLLRDPTHVCLKCGRASNDKKRLCKPQSMES
ncbi:MAG: hypothetical protein LWX11_11020 [Firmicutes bacterium]|nr:hypothetical protein [Bacillota bacterium]